MRLFLASLIVINVCLTTAVFAGTAAPNLTKAKQDAESKGYVFLTSK